MSTNDDKLSVPKFSSFKPQPVTTGATSKASNAEDETRSLKAPKFSSFKPKEAEPSRRERDRDRHRDSGRSSQQTDKPHHSHARRQEHRNHDEHPRKRSRNDHSETPIVSRPRSHHEGLPGVYVIDVRGDPLIRRYGESDRAPASFYRRYGAGAVLGTAGRLIIHRDGPRDQFSLRMPGEGRSLAKDHGGLRSRQFRPSSEPIFLRSKPKHVASDEDDEFLIVDERRKHKLDGDDTDSSDDEQPSYRSYHDHKKLEQLSDSDEEADPSVVADVSLEQSNPLKWKSIQLNRAVKEHPDNIEAWLELVDHQDILLQAGQSLGGVSAENEAHSYAEIKLSMLESALPHASKPEDKKRVLARLMREGVKVWNTKTALKKWAEVVSEEEHDFELWKIHLDFFMSTIATFQHEDAKSMLLDRLRLIMNRGPYEPFHQKFQEAIYVFLRLTCLLQDAGYRESAVAAWQCILELNYFRPSGMENNEPALQLLEEFWEAEVPRIGEAEAQGLAVYAESASGEPPEPIPEPIGDVALSRDTYKAWGLAEQSCAKRARTPARALDEGNDDDPFRVVIFKDISDMMFSIPSKILPLVTEQLIDSFLLFSGHPPAFKSCEWSEMAFDDQFIWRNRDVLANEESWDHTNSDVNDVEARQPPFEIMGLSITVPPDLLFASTAWSRSFNANADKHLVPTDLVLNIIKQLVLKAGIEKLAPYHLALSFCHDTGSVKKSAKMLLRQYPYNADLYNAYAMAEIACGHHEVSQKVLESATEIPLSSGEVGSTLLWRSWSLMELANGNIEMAIKRLCAAYDKSLQNAEENHKAAPMQLLKAHSAFASRVEKCFLGDDLNSVGVFIEAMVLLAYLQADDSTEPKSAAQGSISAAMAVLHMMSRKFEVRGANRSAYHERVLQFGAKLLHLHACNGPFRRVFMREQLAIFLEKFPRNVVFLSLFEWSDSSIRVIDETRKILSEGMLTAPNDNVRSRIMAIRHELSRGNIHSVKGAFERALLSDACKFNPNLWASYMRFSRSQTKLRKRAKETFYRALRHCPWSKGVMMEAFTTLVGDFDSDELKAVYNTMTSKGLRIHVDLEDFLARRQAERQHKTRNNKRQ